MKAPTEIRNEKVYGSKIINDIIEFVDNLQNASFKVENSEIKDSTVINNVTIALSKSFEYDQLNLRKKELEENLSFVPANDQIRLLDATSKLNHHKELIKKFILDILNLSEQFSRISINTELLSRAKEYFIEGKFTEARTLLKEHDEQTEKEETILWTKDEEYKTHTQSALAAKAQQRLIQAVFEQTNYGNPDWFADTCDYFERSIKSHQTKYNIFLYGSFLQNNNQFKEAEVQYKTVAELFADDLDSIEKASLYESLGHLSFDRKDFKEAINLYAKALGIWQIPAEINPDEYQIDVVHSLNNLGEAYKEDNVINLSREKFEEALKMCKKLFEQDSVKYSSDLIAALNNLGNLNTREKNYVEAAKHYLQAYEILNRFDEQNMPTYLDDKARLLFNLGVALQLNGEVRESLNFHLKALEIREKLAEFNAKKYMPDLADSHYRVGEVGIGLIPDQTAFKNLSKSLSIYNNLAHIYPQNYISKVAMVLRFLAIIYEKYVPRREQSIDYALQAIKLLFPIYEHSAEDQAFLENCLDILANWGLSDAEIYNLIHGDKELIKEN